MAARAAELQDTPTQAGRQAGGGNDSTHSSGSRTLTASFLGSSSELQHKRVFFSALCPLVVVGVVVVVVAVVVVVVDIVVVVVVVAVVVVVVVLVVLFVLAQVPYLQPGEVMNLFHEFGHALHAMFSRSK
jgi:hypothetical protein